MNTDVEWEKWGQRDPYFGVLRDEKYRSRNLTDESRSEFFESGRAHAAWVLEICRRHFDKGFTPKRALDLGCGVGRVLIPLAQVAEHAVGLDVSRSMLEEARKNCGEHSVSNVSLLESDDDLSCLDGYYDFIHSSITFQHIPVGRGRKIFSKLLDHLDDRGMGAIQVTYAKMKFASKFGVPPAESPMKRALRATAQMVRKAKRNVHPGGDPESQMNAYNLNELLFLIQSTGIHDVHVEFTDHGGELGIFLYFRKPGPAS